MKLCIDNNNMNLHANFERESKQSKFICEKDCLMKKRIGLEEQDQLHKQLSKC